MPRRSIDSRPLRARARLLVGALAAALWMTPGCASMSPVPDLGEGLSFTPRAAASPLLAQRSTPDAPRPAAGGQASLVDRTERQDVTRTRQAVQEAIHEIEGTTRRLAEGFHRLAVRPAGVRDRAPGVFEPFAERGEQPLRWMEGALKCSTRWATAASEVADPDMQLALLRLTGPRLQSALFASVLLSAWLDYLNLVEAVVQHHCPPYSIEHLFRETRYVWELIEPSLVTLSSLEPERLEATAKAMPGLMDQLTRAFNSTREAVPRAEQSYERLLMAQQLIEMATTAGMLKRAIPPLLPVGPVALGAGLVMGAEGVTIGTQVVVSTEWMELMRRLVRAGVLTVPAASAIVRIQAGQLMMSQAPDDLPKGVREALGEGPEVDGMHETGRKGAGMAERPQHHVLPREHREWFEKRGFTDEMSIDHFCVEMQQAEHEAIHGGGDWRLGRTWPGEWNQMIMRDLANAETRAGRMLTRNEILDIVAEKMEDYKVPLNFTPWRGR